MVHDLARERDAGQDRSRYAMEADAQICFEIHHLVGERVVGELVNLERAMAAHVRFGGHFVQAHVDTTITLVDKVPDGDSVRLTFELADDTMLPYLIPKGYVALDGASLTLTFVDDEQRRFGVMLIKHTQEKITLGRKKVGSKVNLEVDMLGKYVQKSVAAALRSSK
jgi:riboflavin synthase